MDPPNTLMSKAWTILPASFPLSTRGSSVELVLLQEHVKMLKSLEVLWSFLKKQSVTPPSTAFK